MRQPLTLVRILLAFLAIVNVYRAATQSFTTDEAFTYNRSVSVPIPKLWDFYDANDHVLHTLLSKASVTLFGVSEFSLRIPSLAGGLLLLWATLALARFAFGDGWLMVLAVALVALNPFVLDYCSIARGYGMATALWLTALVLLIKEAWTGQTRWRMPAAGFLLGLAVSANLTVLLPAIALIAGFAVVFALPAVMDRHWPRFRARANRIADQIVVPAIVVATAILLVPLLPAARSNFYVGASTAAQSLLSFGEALFWRADPVIYGNALLGGLRPELSRAFAYGVLPLLMAGAALAAVLRALAWLRLKRTPDPADQFLITAGLVLILCVVGIDFLHWMQGVPYPYRRTGFYFVPVVTLLGAALFSGLRHRFWRVVGWAVAAVALTSFVLNFNVRYYDEWSFDAGTRDLMREVARLKPAGKGKLRLSTSGYVEQTARFYATYYRLDWLVIQPRKEGEPPEGDCYLLIAPDRGLVASRGLEVKAEHAVSHAVVAVATGGRR